MSPHGQITLSANQQIDDDDDITYIMIQENGEWHKQIYHVTCMRGQLTHFTTNHNKAVQFNGKLARTKM